MNPHIDKNTLLLFLYEELPVKELRAAREHLDRCRACRRELSLLQDVLEVYRQLPLEVPPDEIFSKVLRAEGKILPSGLKVHSWLESFFGTPHRRRVFQFKTAVVALIFLLGSVFILFRQVLKHTAPSPPGSAVLISEWRSPTDFLLKNPGEELLKTIPRLGASAEEIKSITHTHNN